MQLVTTGVISPEEARTALAEDEKSGFNSIDIDAVPDVLDTGNKDLFGAFDEYLVNDKKDINGMEHDPKTGQFVSSGKSKNNVEVMKNGENKVVLSDKIKKHYESITEAEKKQKR